MANFVYIANVMFVKDSCITRDTTGRHNYMTNSMLKVYKCYALQGDFKHDQLVL